MSLEAIAREAGTTRQALQTTTDPQVASRYRSHVIAPRRTRLRSILERAVEAGLLDPEPDLTIAVTMLTGSWYARCLAADEEPENWATAQPIPSGAHSAERRQSRCKVEARKVGTSPTARRLVGLAANDRRVSVDAGGLAPLARGRRRPACSGPRRRVGRRGTTGPRPLRTRCRTRSSPRGVSRQCRRSRHRA
jgi:hypothetical protein